MGVHGFVHHDYLMMLVEGIFEQFTVDDLATSFHAVQSAVHLYIVRFVILSVSMMVLRVCTIEPLLSKLLLFLFDTINICCCD